MQVQSYFLKGLALLKRASKPVIRLQNGEISFTGDFETMCDRACKTLALLAETADDEVKVGDRYYEKSKYSMPANLAILVNAARLKATASKVNNYFIKDAFVSDLFAEDVLTVPDDNTIDGSSSYKEVTEFEDVEPFTPGEMESFWNEYNDRQVAEARITCPLWTKVNYSVYDATFVVDKSGERVAKVNDGGKLPEEACVLLGITSPYSDDCLSWESGPDEEQLAKWIFATKQP